MTFFDRAEELTALENAFESPEHEFYVVYGRRRVGKTELLKEFCANRSHIYFLTAQEAERRQREKFVRKIAGHFDDRVPRVDGWEEAAQFAVSYSSVWKDGKFEGDVYEVDPDQVSKTPESGEYIEKGSFVVRGDREYYRDTSVGVAVGNRTAGRDGRAAGTGPVRPKRHCEAGLPDVPRAVRGHQFRPQGGQRRPRPGVLSAGRQPDGR